VAGVSVPRGGTHTLHPNPPVATKRGAELDSFGELVREPLQSSMDYGSLLRSAYLNASIGFPSDEVQALCDEILPPLSLMGEAHSLEASHF
jgi:hypothetical protein